MAYEVSVRSLPTNLAKAEDRPRSPSGDPAPAADPPPANLGDGLPFRRITQDHIADHLKLQEKDADVHEACHT